MHLENIVWDAREPGRLHQFWAAALGADPIPDDDCSRLHLGGGAFLDLCFQPVTDAPAPHAGKNRLHLDVRRSNADDLSDDALRALGARRLDGAAGLPWVVYADPSGNEVCVLEPSVD